MSTNGTTTATTATATTIASAASTAPVAAHPEQLTLLSTSDVPLQFRIDERTRRSGLAHVAALRAQVADQAAKRNLTAVGKRPLTRASRQIAA